MKRVYAVLTVLSLMVAGVAMSADTAQAHEWRAADVGTSSLPSGLTFPVSASAPGQGSFTGTLRIARFAVHEGKLVAFATVTGTRVDEAGVSTAIMRTVSLPASVTPGTASALAVPGTITTLQAPACSILHLDLGPLDLNLLGLVVHLNEVVLDISAEPGAGNLLGNLLCGITNLLNGLGSLAAISNLLNQLLGLLG